MRMLAFGTHFQTQRSLLSVPKKRPRYQENQRPTAAAALEHPWFQEGMKFFTQTCSVVFFDGKDLFAFYSVDPCALFWGCCQSFRIPKLLLRWFLMFRTEMLKDVEVWEEQQEKKNQPSCWSWNPRHIYWSILCGLGGATGRLVSGADWWWNRGWWGVDMIAFRHKDVPCMVLCSHFVRQSEPSDEACDGCQKQDRKIKSFLILSQSALLQDP